MQQEWKKIGLLAFNTSNVINQHIRDWANEEDLHFNTSNVINQQKFTTKELRALKNFNTSNVINQQENGYANRPTNKFQYIKCY